MLPAKFWVFSTFFAVGVIAGLSYLLMASPQDPLRTEPSPNPTTQLTAPHDSHPLVAPGPAAPRQNESWPMVPESLNDVVGSDRETVAAVKFRDQGDSYLIAGNTKAAMLQYRKCQKLSGRITSDISLRMGFCAELESEPGTAARHFQRVLEGSVPDNHRLLALSGLSRSWIERGNRREALNILSDLFLLSLNRSMPEEIKAQIVYQLATALQDIAFRKYHYDLTRSDGIAFHMTDPDVTVLLELLNRSSLTTPGSDGMGRQLAMHQASSEKVISTDVSTSGISVEILQRPNDSIDLTVVNIDSVLRPVSYITKHLASACDLELFASAEAKAIITGRSRSLNAKNIQASMLLDHLLIPLDLFWFQDEKGIHLLSRNEPSVESHAEQFWVASMDRALRRFNVTFPGDYRQQSALLSRGNLKFIEGDLDRAATYYQELLNQNPQDELLARLFFNVGKIDMRLGRNTDAIKHIYHAVDQSYDSLFQSSGYWLVGQLLLESNQLEEAITASGRALSLARTNSQRRLPALTMARAYLLSNQPYSANQVLFENRKSFAGTPAAPTAAVLGAYARYVGTTDEISRETERNRLLAAVAMAPDENYHNFLDIYIAARAFLELGFQEKAIKKLTLATNSTTIPQWRNRFLFELGVQLSISGDWLKAAKVFEFLTSDNSHPWVQPSNLQLAAVYLDLGREQDCIALCRRMLGEEIDESTQSAALNTMGKAYQKLNEHHTAALCFAGLIPEARHTMTAPETN